MGNEIGHFREWDEKREQDWNLLEYPAHQKFHQFMTQLNSLYLKHPAFYEKDYAADGFQWLDCHQERACIYAFARTGGQEQMIAVFNFSNEQQEDYQLKLTDTAKLTLLLSSDDVRYGGCDENPQQDLIPEDGVCHMNLPPFSAAFYIAATKD